MRGGALALLVWGAILAVLMAICWVWTGDAIQVGTFAFAVAVVWTGAALLVAAAPQALRRGPPPATEELTAITSASAGAVLAAIAVAALCFGLAFGRFLVYFGAGLLILAVAMLVREWTAERRARQTVSRRARS